MSRARTPGQFIPAHWRSWAIVGAFILFGALLVWRAIDLQVFDEPFLSRQGDMRHLHTLEVPAHRGAIVDRNGVPLALSAPAQSVWALPRAVLDDPEKIPALARRLGVSASALEKRLRKYKDRQFLYLKRQISPYDAQQIMDLDAPGIFLQREYKRYYPAGEAAAQLVGLTNTDGEGQTGLELARNEYLAGAPGKRRVIKDGRGHVVDDLEEFEPPEPGHDLKLTIDARLQYIAYRALKETVLKHKASDGTVVLMDPKSGHLLAVASYPSFNPNDRSTLKTEGMRLRAATDVMEPGSASKPILLSGALSSGLFSPSSIIPTNGHFKVGSLTVRDAHDNGDEDLAQILQKSSNVGAAKIGLEMGPQKIWETFRNFGFGETTGSGFPGERFGVFKDYYTWGDVETATASYGYGYAVTPLQLIRAYGAIANDGKLHSLQLVQGKGANMLPPPQQAITPESARQMRKMLKSVVSMKGTGWRAQVPGYTVGGKTGTTRTLGPGGYQTDSHRALFVGMAPSDDPDIVMLAEINAPTKGTYYGGTVSAPLFSKVMGQALRILHVPPDDPESAASSSEKDRS